MEVPRIPKRLLPVKTEKTVYFEKSGRENTEETLMLAKNRADELEIRNIIVASSGGGTGVAASEVFKGYNLVVVTSVAGYSKPNQIRIMEEHRKVIKANGAMKDTALLEVMRGLKSEYALKLRALSLRSKKIVRNAG